MMRKLLVIGTLLLLSITLVAQNAPKAEVFGGYSLLRNSGTNFNGGWEGQFTGYFGKNFGVTADVSGHYRNVTSIGISGLSASANQRLYNFLFGPTVTGRFGKHAIFGHALFGAAHSRLGAGFAIPIIGGFSTGVNSATAFAMALGGGVDLGLTDHFAIRPAQVDYLYTHFNTVDALTTGLSNTSNNHQNSFRYSAGVVFRF